MNSCIWFRASLNIVFCISIITIIIYISQTDLAVELSVLGLSSILSHIHSSNKLLIHLFGIQHAVSTRVAELILPIAVMGRRIRLGNSEHLYITNSVSCTAVA